MINFSGFNLFDYQFFQQHTGEIYRLMNPHYYDMVIDVESVDFYYPTSGSLLLISGEYHPAVTAGEYCFSQGYQGYNYIEGNVVGTGDDTTYFDPSTETRISTQGGTTYSSITCLNQGTTTDAIQTNLMYSMYTLARWVSLFVCAYVLLQFCKEIFFFYRLFK